MHIPHSIDQVEVRNRTLIGQRNQGRQLLHIKNSRILRKC